MLETLRSKGTKHFRGRKVLVHMFRTVSNISDILFAFNTDILLSILFSVAMGEVRERLGGLAPQKSISPSKNIHKHLTHISEPKLKKHIFTVHLGLSSPPDLRWHNFAMTVAEIPNVRQYRKPLVYSLILSNINLSYWNLSRVRIFHRKIYYSL